MKHLKSLDSIATTHSDCDQWMFDRMRCYDYSKRGALLDYLPTSHALSHNPVSLVFLERPCMVIKASSHG